MRIKLVLAAMAALALQGCDTSKTESPSVAAQGLVQAAPAVATVEALDNLKGFIVGAGASAVSRPTAYVLFDPQCPHCAVLWANAKPLSDKVKLKWIPVGLLNRLSTVQSAMLLEAKDPIALMDFNEAAMTRTKRPSTNTADVSDATINLVKTNTAMLRTLNATSVPTIVYRNRETRELATVSGSLPTDKLAELLGVQAPTTK